MNWEQCTNKPKFTEGDTLHTWDKILRVAEQKEHRFQSLTSGSEFPFCPRLATKLTPYEL